MKKIALIAILVFVFIFRTSAAFAMSADTIRVFYAIDSSQLSGANKGKVKVIIDSLAKDQPVLVRGFADYLGSKNHNQPLSENRALVVKDYLLSLSQHLSITAEGEGQVPAMGEKYKSGEPNNRRVEIIFSKISIVKTKPKTDTPTLISTRFEKKIDSLGSVEVGKSLSLDELTFVPGRHHLDLVSQQLLKILTQYLVKNKNLVFEVRGHICCDYSLSDGYDFDTQTYNLSVNRAKEVYEYFIQGGIDKSRMTYAGVGSQQPKVYPERSANDQRLNRRVEIVVISK